MFLIIQGANVALRVVFLLHLVLLSLKEEEKEVKEEAVWNWLKIFISEGAQLNRNFMSATTGLSLTAAASNL